MSRLAVVPSPRVPVANWMPEIAIGLRKLNAHGLEEVRVLGDNVPATASWVANPMRQNSGMLFKPVVTDWTAPDNVRKRNEELLSDLDFVVILGHIATSSARHAMARAFSNPKLHVVQVIDGEATIVGSKTVLTAPGMEILEPKAAGQREDSVWSEFSAPARKSTKK